MDPIAVVAERIAQARCAVAFTGAGVSAESGLDTFRDAGGLWDRFDPDEVATAGGWLAFLIAKPWEGIGFLSAIRDAFGAARPNPAHRALAQLEDAGRLHAVITQNVDGLHREAGSRNVVELHGTFTRKRCTSCGRRADIGREAFVADLDAMIAKLGSYMVSHPAHLLTRCACEGLERADFVAFGEPVQSLDAAMEAASGADVMLVCGSSGAVYPAASLPELAKDRGAFVVEVDPQPTELSRLADVRVGAPAGEALPRIARAVLELTTSPGRAPRAV